MLKYLQIIRVNYPPTQAGKAQKIAYVEFGDEEAMKAALAGHAEVSGCPLNQQARLMLSTDVARCATRSQASNGP